MEQEPKKRTERRMVAGRLVMQEYGPISEMDDSFWFEYWQRQTPGVRFDAIWGLVRDYHVGMKGLDENELRCQRTAGALQRLPR
jgi:hypothetical protein